MTLSTEKTSGSIIHENSAFAVIIPVYNHGSRLADVVEKARRLDLPVIVVDDGSTDGGPDSLNGVEGVEVLRHSVNRGKGAAILTGFRRAAEIADWAITIDADGQHHPEDAGVLNISILEVAEQAATPSEPQRARFMAKAMMPTLALSIKVPDIRSGLGS